MLRAAQAPRGGVPHGTRLGRAERSSRVVPAHEHSPHISPERRPELSYRSNLAILRRLLAVPRGIQPARRFPFSRAPPRFRFAATVPGTVETTRRLALSRSSARLGLASALPFPLRCPAACLGLTALMAMTMAAISPCAGAVAPGGVPASMPGGIRPSAATVAAASAPAVAAMSATVAAPSTAVAKAGAAAPAPTPAASATSAASPASAATATVAATAAILGKRDPNITEPEGHVKVRQERNKQKRHDHHNRHPQFLVHPALLSGGSRRRVCRPTLGLSEAVCVLVVRCAACPA